MTRTLFRSSFGAVLLTIAGVAAQAEEGLVEPVAFQAPGVERASSGNRLEATAALLYLQPVAGNLEYGTLVNPLPAPSPHWVNHSVDPELSPAFSFGLRYIVPEHGNDLRLSWTHLDASESDSFTADPIQFVGPPYEIGPDAGNFDVANGHVDFEYDAVNLDAGHLFSQGGPAQVRVFAGMQYARISQELTGTFASDDQTLSNSNTTSSLFNGVGPRLGMQAECVKGRFDFLGEIAGSALIGRMESRLDFEAVSPDLANLGITPPNRQSITSPDATQVIPSIDSKLGAGCTFPLSNGGIIRIEAGYQAAVYINAVNQYSISDVVVPPNVQGIGVFLESAYHLQSNFAVHGPYMSASWAF